MEIEVKIPVDFAKFSKLLEMFAVNGEFKLKKDSYFSKYDTYNERKENNETLIRIREENEDCFITTKKKTILDGVEKNTEIETKVEKYFFFNFLLNDIGLKNYFSKNKKTWLMNINGTNTELEIINDKYFYVEIEYITSTLENIQDATIYIKQVCESLGLNYEDRDTRSWMEIISEEK